MHWLSVVSQIGLWLAVLGVAFLLIGVMRRLAVLGWRLDELAAVTPSRVNRSGLAPGAAAPGFELPGVDGRTTSLADLRGRRALVAFLAPGCGPCEDVVPALNELADAGEVAVAAISRGELEENQAWAREHGARFPVLVQQRRDVARSYEVFATPFAFVIDRKGTIAGKGIVNEARHVEMLHAAARDGEGTRAWATV